MTIYQCDKCKYCFASKQKLTQHQNLIKTKPCAEIKSSNAIVEETITITIKNFTLTQLIAMFGEQNIINFNRNSIIETKPEIKQIIETKTEVKPKLEEVKPKLEEVKPEPVVIAEPVVKTKPEVKTLIINKVDINKYIETAKELNNNIIETRLKISNIIDRKQRKTKETNQMSESIIEMTKNLIHIKKALKIAGCDIKKIQFKKEFKKEFREPEPKPEPEEEEEYGDCKFVYKKR